MTKVHGLVGMCPRLDLSPIREFMRLLKCFQAMSLKAPFKQNMDLKNLKRQHRFNNFFVKEKGGGSRRLKPPRKTTMKNFVELFSGLKRAHGCTYVEKKSADGTKVKGQSFVKREPVTDKLWQDHLSGIEPSLGIIPIDENINVDGGCIDVDKYNLNHKKLINLINSNQLPLTVCRSKSGGAHIFLLRTVPVEAKLMRDRLSSISCFFGIWECRSFP